MKKIILAASMLLAFSVAKSTCVSCLVASYPFNGNANDASGNGYNGTNNNASLTTDRYGNANSAYSFNGSTSYIDLGNNAALKRYNSDYTITAWVQPSAYSSSYQSLIVSNRGNNGEGSGLVLLGTLNGTDQGKVANLVSGGGSSTQVVGSEVLSTGTWYHVAVTYKYNGSNNNDVKVYVNGVLKASAVQKDIKDPAALNTYIGFEPSPSSPVAYHFNGKIDDVKIYSCVLPGENIYNQYSDENSHLVAYYPFCGDAADASGNGYNGTNNNASLTTDRYGNANSAYSFNGSTSYIDLGNNAALKRYNSDYTITAWVQPSAYSSSYQSLIVSNRGNNGEGSGLVLLGTLNGTDQGKVANLVSGGGSNTQVVGSEVLSTGTWYHVAVTYKYNGSNNNDVKVYVNGVLKASAVQKDIKDPAALNTYIGFEPSPSSPAAYHFNGKIDDVRIYNSVLSSAFISNLYGVNDNIQRTGAFGDANSSLNIQLYPNPASNYLNIQCDNNVSLERVIILSATGAELYNQTVKGAAHTVPVHGYEKGIYTVIVQSSNGVKTDRLFIY